jgi:hypothetical protein
MAAKSETVALPATGGTICLSPEYRSWRKLMARNRNALSLLAMSRSRQELLRIAHSYTVETLRLHSGLDASEPVIVTGHQANWHHCGILAKDVAACRFARDTNGCAVHLVLDHDITDTSVMLPVQRQDGTWHRFKVAIPSRRIDLVEIARTFPSGSLCSGIWPQAADLSGFANTASAITCLHAALHSALGLKMLYLPVSLLSESEAFLNFVCSVISNAGLFAATYNNAIEEHLLARKIDRRRTLRALVVDAQAHLIELPFWLIDGQGERTSLRVTSATDTITITNVGTLESADSNAVRLKTVLKASGYSIRPKAVTLTLFARLYLADWFVHGLGAAAYEYITDHVLENFYRLTDHAFGTATATMTLPLAQRVSEREIGRRRFRRSMETVNERGFFFGLFSEDALRRLIDTMPTLQNAGRTYE